MSVEIKSTYLCQKLYSSHYLVAALVSKKVNTRCSRQSLSTIFLSLTIFFWVCCVECYFFKKSKYLNHLKNKSKDRHEDLRDMIEQMTWTF